MRRKFQQKENLRVGVIKFCESIIAEDARVRCYRAKCEFCRSCFKPDNFNDAEDSRGNALGLLGTPCQRMPHAGN